MNVCASVYDEVRWCIMMLLEVDQCIITVSLDRLILRHATLLTTHNHISSSISDTP